MTDAPERIWLLVDEDQDGQFLELIGAEGGDADDTEYIRADLAPTDAQVMAHPKVRALVEAVNFLSDRLHAFSLTDDADEMCAEFIGHVEPAHARLCAALRDLEAP